MTMYQTPQALAQKLISLPSYVDENSNETPVTDFLFEYLHTVFPEMILEKQYLKNSRRCNLVLRGKGRTKLFVLGHIDTVQPKAGWQTNPLQPIVQHNKLYGLGAADMKSSLASFLIALQKVKQTLSLDTLMLLMYVDEEYDFLGIKRFLDDTSSNITPAMTLSLDGELAVGTGCRGLIELQLTFTGKSGHAANPENGVNAITQSLAVLQDVSDILATYKDDELGATTTNVAYIQGGARQDGKTSWSQEGNVIADTSTIIFEVRPSVKAITADAVLKKIRMYAKQRKLSLSSSAIRHDITPWPVLRDSASLRLLQGIYKKANVPFTQSSRKLQGYIDAQMVAEKIPAPTFIIGTGGENKHGANENVPLENLTKATRLYATLLEEVLA